MPNSKAIPSFVKEDVDLTNIGVGVTVTIVDCGISGSKEYKINRFHCPWNVILDNSINNSILT